MLEQVSRSRPAGQAAIVSRVFRAGFIEEVTCEQRRGGGEGDCAGGGESGGGAEAKVQGWEGAWGV